MDINFNKNEDHNKLLVSDLRQKLTKVKLGGGKARIEKHHSKGKMTEENVLITYWTTKQIALK